MFYEDLQLFQLGTTRVLPWLWLGGEDEVENILPQVDLWIDFREEDELNQVIQTPDHLIVVRMPMYDGDGEMAAKVFPLAKLMLDNLKRQGKKALISCHAGVSRSATVALWVMADECGFERAWRRLKELRPQVCPSSAFRPLIKQIADRERK